MEYESPEGDKKYTCETQAKDNRSSVAAQQTSSGVNKTDPVDKKSDSNMKETYTLRECNRSLGMNMDQTNREDPSPCADMSLDNSKEDSDFSDYCEDNNRCQLANQALRAKLLNGVFNPINGSDSKLRVSVFDHRIIPKKLVIARKNDNHTGVDSTDNLNNKVKSQSGANVNDQDNTNTKKGQSLSYTVLKASRKASTDNQSGDSKGENCSKMESDSEYRTRFDVLLRNLIGDVSGMQVEPSPMTVSSGYESDYIQTRESDIDKMFNTNKKLTVDNKETIQKTQQPSRIPNGYHSVSEKYPENIPSSSLTDNHQFTSLPSIPTQQTEKPKLKSFEDRETVKHQKPDFDSNGFSYAQRHNYKLTKVTRSMYEIIHDLQNGEKIGPDGRKRSRKGRRTSQDGNTGSDGSNSARENKPNVRIPSENDTGTLNRNKDTNGSSISGSVVRCVRRPLCNDSSFRPAQRKQSQSENHRLTSSSSNNDCDKVQNDLRNLLCDTSDVTLSSVCTNDRVGDFNTFSATTARQDTLVNGHTDTGFNQVDVSITQNSAGVQRRPTLTEQFIKRTKPDDHVYETIPGDEKLYEEWKKMRANPKIPKIRRYTTVPDLPGTFIPKDPPALPERRYLSNNNNSNPPNNKDNDDYIFMGDINSNFPSNDPLTRSELKQIPVLSERGLEPRLFHGYPYTLHDENVFSQSVRSDETSDGYCSIDNLSLLRENVIDSPSPVQTERDWRPSQTHSLPRVPLKRSDFFLHPYNQKQNGFNLSSSHLFTDRPSVSDRPLPRTEDSNSALLSVFERDSGKPVFQATYV